MASIIDLVGNTPMVEIKKLNALFELINFCDKDFKRKKTFKPIKEIFQQAGAVYDSDTPAGADGDCVSVARARRMTIRAFSIQVLAAIHPPCGGCRIIVGCALAANGLS